MIVDGGRKTTPMQLFTVIDKVYVQNNFLSNICQYIFIKKLSVFIWSVLDKLPNDVQLELIQYCSAWSLSMYRDMLVLLLGTVLAVLEHGVSTMNTIATCK